MRSPRRCSAYNTDTLRKSRQAVEQGSDAAFHELGRVKQREQREKVSRVRIGPQGSSSNRRRRWWRHQTHRRAFVRNQFATWFTCPELREPMGGRTSYVELRQCRHVPCCASERTKFVRLDGGLDTSAPYQRISAEGARNLATVMDDGQDLPMAMRSIRNHLGPMALLNCLTMLQMEYVHSLGLHGPQPQATNACQSEKQCLATLAGL